MKFCLNIYSIHTAISLRLQKDFNWAKCNNPTILSPNDFFTEDAIEILNRQEMDYNVTWEGKTYNINSEMGIDFFSDKVAYYEVYCLRNSYPLPPERAQLENILLNGDDSLDNILILGVNGKFGLIQPQDLIPYKRDANIVFQNECYIAGNGYVGPAINDEKFENYILDVFRTNLYFWKEHLRTMKTHYQDDRNKGVDIDDLLDIYDELRIINQQYT